MIKNIDLEATIDDIEKLFSKFGLVNKVTLICDKYSGKSKGYLRYFNIQKKIVLLMWNMIP